MGILKAAIAVAVLAMVLALPAVARADVVEIRAGSAGDTTVTALDDVYLNAGWIDAYKPKAVLQASLCLESEFSVYKSGESLPLWDGDTDDGTWSSVMPYYGPFDPRMYWHPKWPHESFLIDWSYRLGRMGLGDYTVVFDHWSTRSLMSWADVDYDGHADLLPPTSLHNEFVIHVVAD